MLGYEASNCKNTKRVWRPITHKDVGKQNDDTKEQASTCEATQVDEGELKL